MAHAHVALAAYESARLLLNKPIFGTQAILSQPGAAIWHNSGSTADRTDTNYPARRAYDGFGHLMTKPTAVSPDKTWYYSLDISVGGVEFDMLAIIGHNLGTLHAGGALTITLEVDDLSDFSAAHSIPITVTTTTSNLRIMQLDLHHTGAVPLRYSSVRYARLKLTRGATNFTPEIGELILGRRRQLKHTPKLPYDATSLHSTSERFETIGGVIGRSIYAAGKFHLSASLDAFESTYIADAIAAFIGCSYGTRPFVWVPLPNSAPGSWYLMSIDEPDFDYPIEDFARRTWQLEATEQGPENYYLARVVY